MPKIDPATGCEVMTTAEFWAAEAEHEGRGRSGGELMAEMYQEMDEEDERTARKIQKDKPGVLKMIRKYLDGADEEDADEDSVAIYGFGSRHIKRVMEVISVRVGGGFRGSEMVIVVKLKLTDDSTRVVEYVSWHDYGTRLDPPDGGEEFAILEVNGIPVVNRFDSDADAPPCAECLRSEPPSTKHGVPNSADYLIPLSDDQGKTVKGWEFRCSYHMPTPSWKDEANLGDWYGPVVELRRNRAPRLPRVREKKDG